MGGEVAHRHPTAMDVDPALDLGKPSRPCTVTTLGVVTRVDPSSPLKPGGGDPKLPTSLRRSSPELVSTPSQASVCNHPGPPLKGRTPPASLLSISANPKPFHENRHHILTFPNNKSTLPRASSLSLEGAGRSAHQSRFTSLDYASQLPTLPVHIVSSRLSAAQAVTGASSKYSRRQAIRSGLWIGPGSSEITKLGIKAQHIGVKSALRKNCAPRNKGVYDKPQLHNILTSADWKTMLEELQMTRALEILEKLKADKAWSYSQIRKPRVPHVPKAHWDHLLDEMSWLQVDFRQERRWKIATAHRLAKQVVDWHQADSAGRQRLQVKVRYPRKVEGPAASEDPTDNTESRHDQSLQSGSPESFRSTPLLPTPISSDTAAIPIAEKLITTETSQASAPESRKTLHQIKRSRVPIFELAPEETMIDVAKLTLEGICPKSIGYPFEHVKLQKLFTDLPIFGDLDSRSDKRPDEASPHLGRITRIAPFLEAKPLLVSTLQPSRNCIGKQWRNLGSLAADDLRESIDSKSDPAHHLPHIFSGRRSKEPKESNILAVPPSPVPNPGRRDLLEWDSFDEELLKQISLTYDFNWKIVADVFNASLARTMSQPVTARDCYDCWTRLNTSAKPTADPDASPAPLKSASVKPPPVPPAGSPTPGDVDAPSEQPAEKDLKSEEKGEEDSSPPAKRASESSALFPNKRATRDDALQDVTRKLRESRAANPPKPSSPTQPRQIVLTAHETHAQAIRPYMTPLEMSALKAERDRQTQAALEMAKRQHQLQQESLIHQARAAAVVAAAAQIPLRNVPSKAAAPAINGTIPSRVPSQPVAVNLTQGRHSGLPGVSIHRQASQTPARFASSPPLHGLSTRGTPSPASHPSATHPSRQSLMDSQGPSTASVNTQPPILPQLPNMPQGFQPRTPNSRSPITGSPPNHHAPNGSTASSNGPHNSSVSHPLTPIQVAQYLQQQQHLHQQRPPEHQMQHPQHQQILQMQQHFQQQGQHPTSSFVHQAVPPGFARQSPSRPHQSPVIPGGQPHLSSGATGANPPTPSLPSSSPPPPQPPA